MVSPNDIILGGWDISSLDLAAGMKRAEVLDVDLQQKLRAQMQNMKPLPAIFDPSFVADNQQERADNVIPGSKKEQLEQVRKDLREFKANNELDKVIVLWTANTERYSELGAWNASADALMEAIERGEKEVSPSTMYAVACVLEGVPFINGSPQNTFVPGVVEMAVEKNVLIGGDDFKSGQTKVGD